MRFVQWAMVTVFVFHSFAPDLANAESPSQPFATGRAATGSTDGVSHARKPASEREARRWLENMVRYHSYNVDEIQAATGLDRSEIQDHLRQFELRPGSPAPRREGENLRMLPYPGGRHPRLGFQNGAVHPHRETKASLFTPWDDTKYVVLDIPEVIFSNLGPLYLAHTDENVPTIWDKQSIKLVPMEWIEGPGGELSIERKLPNQVKYGARLTQHPDHLEMEMWVVNGTDKPLTGLKSQVCVLLRGTPEFEVQTNDNKHFWKDYAACRNPEGTRWVIAAFTPQGRAWANAKCPCLHADPMFPDCVPRQTVRARGWLSFYEGNDIKGELKRIESLAWREPLDEHGNVEAP